MRESQTITELVGALRVPLGQLGDAENALSVPFDRPGHLHPADLVAELDNVLTNRRRPDRAPTGDLHTDGRADDRGEQLDPGADASVLLAALAHARTPLSVDDLARTLGWPLRRVETALDHARHHPYLAGPMTLRRVPPETFTLTPRLDVLTTAQQQAIRASTSSTNVLAEEEAIVLLGALAYGHGPRYTAIRDQHRHADAVLERAGILSRDHTLRVSVNDDVLYSLRYRDDTHIADQHASGHTAAPLTSSPRDH